MTESICLEKEKVRERSRACARVQMGEKVRETEIDGNNVFVRLRRRSDTEKEYVCVLV